MPTGMFPGSIPTTYANLVSISSVPSVFIFSTVEGVSNTALTIAYIFLGLIMLIVLLLGYMLYMYIKNPKVFNSTVNNWFQDFKHGFIAYGLPSWWDKFSATNLAKFIRIGGSLCIITMRVIMPNYPQVDSFINGHIAVLGFVTIMTLLFFAYFLVLSACNLWSAGKYLKTGLFMKFNSPFMLEGTLRRMAGLAAKSIGAAAGGTFVYGSSVSGFDDFQRNVFNASNNQLVSTQMRVGVDAIKEATGYNARYNAPIAPTPKPAELGPLKEVLK